MRIVRAPDEFVDGGRSVFLAGGITGCPEWQDRLVELVDPGRDLQWTALNPRRIPWPDDPGEAERQIAWEHLHLRQADIVSFWFPAEGLCQITLYELGAMSMTTKPLVVGVDPAYARRDDVRIQTKLARPDVCIVRSLEEVAGELRYYIATLEAQASPARGAGETR